MNTKNFEYKIINHSVCVGVDTLNALGLDGWMLVSHTAVNGVASIIEQYIFIREIIKTDE